LLRFTGTRGRSRSHKAFAILFAVFTTGFSTMAMQIALLFSFQSIYGFIYEMVGLIIAFFMGGLSLGAYLGNHHLKKKNSLSLFGTLQLAIALLAFIFAVLLPPAAAVNSALLLFVFFALLTFSAGLINGLDFPVATACYLSLGKSAEKTAGAVYGTELFGACCGAILASAFIVPIQGIIACCYFAAVANATAFIIIFIAGRS
jgi:spermidine synthase